MQPNLKDLKEIGQAVNNYSPVGSHLLVGVDDGALDEAEVNDEHDVRQCDGHTAVRADPWVQLPMAEKLLAGETGCWLIPLDPYMIFLLIIATP